MVKDLLMLLAGRDTYDAKAHSCQRERKALRTLPDHPRINAEPFPRRTASVNDEASEQGRRSFKLGVMTTWPEFAVISTGNGAPNPVKMMPRSLRECHGSVARGSSLHWQRQSAFSPMHLSTYGFGSLSRYETFTSPFSFPTKFLTS
jgi:hypothetical protein